MQPEQQSEEIPGTPTRTEAVLAIPNANTGAIRYSGAALVRMMASKTQQPPHQPLCNAPSIPLSLVLPSPCFPATLAFQTHRSTALSPFFWFAQMLQPTTLNSYSSFAMP